MEVRIWDVRLSVTNKYEEMELIKTIDGLEMYKDLNFGGFITIDGKSYRHCMYNKEQDLLCVEPVEFNEKGSEIEYSNEFICPYCNSIDHDAWDLRDDEGKTICGSCGSEIEYERVVTVEYNVRPVKCAPVTKI